MPPKKPLYYSETMLCPPSIFLLLLKNSIAIQLAEKIVIIERLTELSNHQIYSLIEVWINEQQDYAESLLTDEHEIIKHKIREAKRDWKVLNMVYDFPTFADDQDTHQKTMRYLQNLNLAKLGMDLDTLIDKNADEQERLSILDVIDDTLDLHADDFFDQVRNSVSQLLNSYQELVEDELLTIHSDTKQ